MKNINNDLGKRIKELRKSKGLLQSDFEDVGCSQSYFSMIESGKVVPDVLQLIGIAKKLNVSILNIINIEINKDNFLSLLEKIDTSLDMDIIEIKQRNGKTKSVILFNDSDIEKKLRSYKFLKDISKSNISGSDLAVYKNKINSME